MKFCFHKQNGKQIKKWRNFYFGDDKNKNNGDKKNKQSITIVFSSKYIFCTRLLLLCSPTKKRGSDLREVNSEIGLRSRHFSRVLDPLNCKQGKKTTKPGKMDFGVNIFLLC